VKSSGALKTASLTMLFRGHRLCRLICLQPVIDVTDEQNNGNKDQDTDHFSLHVFLNNEGMERDVIAPGQSKSFF
jgi:hypothetical protein